MDQIITIPDVDLQTIQPEPGVPYRSDVVPIAEYVTQNIESTPTTTIDYIKVPLQPTTQQAPPIIGPAAITPPVYETNTATQLMTGGYDFGNIGDWIKANPGLTALFGIGLYFLLLNKRQ